eukprot:CAMPEP_0184681396 /NCGR_PEP_ID=MMETSP0312-20130426/4362_1 /TAXON_ID=31354 /ORGANISM="Compsopogon coeruleus, Strain SAG 36.94" /LENGTH=449 /DNA_ID=CAMNT_0027132195 /DNA_START=148 /DNA_END=1493 /DNA_ORIENTATION=+
MTGVRGRWNFERSPKVPWLGLVVRLIASVLCAGIVNVSLTMGLELGATSNPFVKTHFDLTVLLNSMEFGKLGRFSSRRNRPGVAGRCGFGEVRIRKEIGDVSQVEWDAFARAVTALHNSQNATGFTGFEQFQDLHSRWNRIAHQGRAFLPWHRMMIFVFESALRKFDSSVTLPYWDSPRDCQYPRGSPAFTGARLGWSQEGSPIKTGWFKNWRSQIPSFHQVTRWLDYNIMIDTSSEINKLIKTNKSYCAFSRALKSVHGSGHLFVGGVFLPQFAGVSSGDMTSVLRSANDPAFYAHHAWTDSVWDRYNQRNPGAWCGNTSMRKFPLRGLHSTALDAVKLMECVRYSPVRRKGASAPFPSRILYASTSSRNMKITEFHDITNTLRNHEGAAIPSSDSARFPGEKPTVAVVGDLQGSVHKDTRDRENIRIIQAILFADLTGMNESSLLKG